MATFVVTTDRDEDDGLSTGGVSLREAIAAANAAPGADRIEFAEPVDRIRLTLGEIEITDALTILGDTDGDGIADVLVSGDMAGDDTTIPGSGITHLDATAPTALEDNTRLFNVTARDAETVIDGLILTGGRTTANETATTETQQSGGAVRSLAPLVIRNSVVEGNGTEGEGATGGGAFAFEGLSLENSVVRANRTEGDEANGGGLLVRRDLSVRDSLIADNRTAGNGADGAGFFGLDNVTVIGTTVSGNRTVGQDSDAGGFFVDDDLLMVASLVSDNATMGRDGDGGGVFADGDITVIGSTISGNSTAGFEADGGGMRGSETITMVNSTVQGNSTGGYRGDGGGLYSNDAMTLIHSTITGNRTTGPNAEGGGLYSFGDLTLRNSIVMGNLSALTRFDEAVEDRFPDDNSDGVIDLQGGVILGGDLFRDGVDVGDARVSDVFAETVPIAVPIDRDGDGVAEEVVTLVAGALSATGDAMPVAALRADAANPALDSGADALALDAMGAPLATDAAGAARIVDQAALSAFAPDAVDLGAAELQAQVGGTVPPDLDETIRGGPGDDMLRGGAGSDVIRGGSGNDTVRGGSGDDLVKGGEGDDFVKGGEGDDLVLGGRGADTLFGGRGDDRIDGGRGPGPDEATGGAGRDTFVYHDGDGLLAIQDFDVAEGDAVTLVGIDADRVADRVEMAVGTDVLVEFEGFGSILFVGLTPSDVLLGWFDV
jgi:hypothetical protein